MCPAAWTQPTASKEPTPEQNGTISQLISHLKSSFRPTDFESVTHLLTARDEAARKEISHWKAKYEAMEKKQGETTLEKIMTEDELRKLKRERDLLNDQVARAETDQRLWRERMEQDTDVRVARFREDQKESEERERKWKEKYEKLWEDFEKVETEKVRLGCRNSALEFEKEKAEREAEECKMQFENLSRRISRLEEDAAVLMSAGVEERREEETGPEERREEEMGPVAVPETSDEILNELVMDGNEGGSNGGEKADLVPSGGGSAPEENGSVVIIEIDDSDDEMPNRKRGVCNDDDGDVKPTKKLHTKSLQDLMDLADGSDSSDTGDSSSSGSESSDIDVKSEIARFRRKVGRDRTWAFKADMISALKREPELCMNAVCALYRKQFCTVKSGGGSSLNINSGFNQFDALRGTTLGKYLTDGDPQGKLKRSITELQEFDPRVLDDCQKLALRHTDQLFEIYQKNQDAFFLP